MRKFLHIVWMWGILGLIWSFTGCATRKVSPLMTSTIGATQVYQTVEFFLTQAHSAITHTAQQTLSASTIVPTMLSSATPLEQGIAQPTATPALRSLLPTRLCDQAAPGSPIDVTIPDNTELMPGQTFTKIWRLQNIGTCTWTTDYAIRFFYGAQMSAPEAIPLRQAVAPGETIEIAVDMVAPQTPGLHQGNWKLRNAAGQLFGIGPNGDAPFWVRIIVLVPYTDTPTITSTFTATPSPTQTSSATPTASPTIPLQAKGNIILAPTLSIDLDTGEINPTNGKDLTYLVDANKLHLLIPEETAILGVFGVSEPSLIECQNSPMSKAALALESLPVGTYLCYRTNQGLIGRLQYISLSLADDTARAEFQTWRVTVP